ncbi:hypothetical protein AciM339_1541 [Aciduliprofundum sp. MAR08-339]|uniref:DUF211 domain-containing protein n=1 Tax=Aciduliprofundum sp. (strain MAR08-339) TaxID=673860 RepID=UPI0002A4C259|nr:hypothetical protein AciM339_1541 [Aciduliprofundum sp. MAR08-339]
MNEKTTYGIRRLVLDVMKPHRPSIVDVALKLSKVEGVNGVNCILNEVDQETESIKVVIEGPNIDFEEVQETLESLGAVIHSIDVAVAGKKIVEDVETPQDR